MNSINRKPHSRRKKKEREAFVLLQKPARKREKSIRAWCSTQDEGNDGGKQGLDLALLAVSGDFSTRIQRREGVAGAGGSEQGAAGRRWQAASRGVGPPRRQ